MAATLNSARVQTNLEIDYRSADGLSKQFIQFHPALSFANGNGAGQANDVYETTLSIGTSATATLTLSALTDAFGNSLVMTKLRALLIEHRTTTTASAVTVGGGTHPVFGTTIAGLIIPNGNFFTYTNKNGLAMVAGTNDVLTIINSDASNVATVRVTILGSQ